MLDQRPSGSLALPVRFEGLARVLPNRLEHPVAPAREADEALLDEGLEDVEVGVCHLLGSLERAAASEDGETGEELLLLGHEQVVAPLDRRSEGLLAGIRVAAAFEQVEPLCKALEDLRGRERLRSGGGELDGERERVEASAQLGDLGGGLELRALAEERVRFGLGEWGHCVLDLAGDAQELAGGDEQGEVGAGAEESRKLGRCLDHLLEVVEEEEHLPFSDVGGERLLGAERLGDGLGHERGIAERGKPDPEDACFVLADERGSCFERQTGLARTARAGEREQARSLLDPREHLRKLRLAAEEGARRTGQVRVRDRLQRRKGALAELVERDGSGDVLEPMLAELRELEVDGRRGRLRADDLAAVGRAHHSRGEVDVHAHVLGGIGGGSPSVDADPDRDRAVCQAGHRLGNGCHRVGGRGEGVEEGVALVVDLVAAVVAVRRAHDPAVLGEGLAVGIRAELLQELRRTLDVAEDERHRANGLGHRSHPGASCVGRPPVATSQSNAARDRWPPDS